MTKNPNTAASDSYREATMQNIDSLGQHRSSIEAEIASLEREHILAVQRRMDELAEGIAELRHDARREIDSMEETMRAQLAPLEQRLLDVVVTLHSQERAVGALPRATATFHERTSGTAPKAADENNGEAGASVEAA